MLPAEQLPQTTKTEPLLGKEPQNRSFNPTHSGCWACTHPLPPEGCTPCTQQPYKPRQAKNPLAHRYTVTTPPHRHHISLWTLSVLQTPPHRPQTAPTPPPRGEAAHPQLRGQRRAQVSQPWSHRTRYLGCRGGRPGPTVEQKGAEEGEGERAGPAFMPPARPGSPDARGRSGAGPGLPRQCFGLSLCSPSDTRAGILGGTGQLQLRRESLRAEDARFRREIHSWRRFCGA